LAKNGMSTTQDHQIAPAAAGRRKPGHARLRAGRPSIPLAELAKQQGVSPADDLDAIADLWPAPDDPDELLEFILTERSARRRLTGSGG